MGKEDLVLKAKKLDLFSVPYCDRKFVTFASEEDLNVSKDGLESLLDRVTSSFATVFSAVGVSRIVSTGAPFVARMVGLELASTGLLAATATVPMAAIAVLGLVPLSRCKGPADGSEVLVVPRVEASKFSLPVGHPLPDTVYVGHPFLPEVYFPFSDFHKFLFEQKITEAMDLVTSLGARTIKTSHKNEKISSAVVKAGGEGSWFGKIFAQGGGEKGCNMNFESEVELDPSGVTPKLPENLVWYDHEPKWRYLGNSIMEGKKFKKYTLSISFGNDFGINGNVAAQLEKVGFEVGGEYSSFENTMLDLNVTF